MGLMDGLMGNAGKIDPAAAQQEYAKLFGNGEQVYAAYVLVRDAIIFTNRRLILIDKQGMTGRKVCYESVPYRAISHFSVETAGHFDLDAELVVFVGGGYEAIRKRFSRSVDIYEVQGMLSHFTSL